MRDGMLTLLAMEVEHGELIDWRGQGLYNPARSASHDLGSVIYPRLNIAGSREALNTGVKGVGRYIDRRTATWTALLRWASNPRIDLTDLRAHIGGAYNVDPDHLDGPRGLGPEWLGDAMDAYFGAKIMQGGDGYVGSQKAAEVYAAALNVYGMPLIERAFHYLAAGVAATARNLPAMPALDTPKLTFPAVFAVLDEILSKSSAGAHEQFTFAALLAAWREQLGEPGLVETKNLNASDASARTAADVQEKHRGQVSEAYELTAAAWYTKVDQATATLRRHDLSRVHIVAKDAARAQGVDIAAIVPPGLDVTVRDVREEVRSLVARLSKPTGARRWNDSMTCSCPSNPMMHWCRATSRASRPVASQRLDRRVVRGESPAPLCPSDYVQCWRRNGRFAC